MLLKYNNSHDIDINLSFASVCSEFYFTFFVIGCKLKCSSECFAFIARLVPP